jgi:uncharacterized protein YndB with AHSA1/START domain
MCNHWVAMRSIERTVILDAPADDVWRAISDEGLLQEWLAPDVELDLRPNGALRCRTEEGEERPGAVELVEDGERLAFHWRRDGAAAQSRVELRLEEIDDGTRLTVTETGLEAPEASEASEGWRTRLESLRVALASLAYT